MNRKVLLVCGILAPLLYLAADVLGGISYPGYNFSSQAISELTATGASSKPLVDGLFFVYFVLAIAFGAGVWRDADGRSRALRIVGALLLGYALVGEIGYSSYPMQQRGAGSLSSDLPHIVVTAGVLLLFLLAAGVGAFALGRRFRIYSLATLAIIIVFTALMVPLAIQLAAGRPTPGLGILERIVVYSMQIWVAVLAVALLRLPRPGTIATPIPTPTNAQVHGMVAPGFEEVRAEFERNFAMRGEIGAAVAAWWRGRKVVDLWGGRRAPGMDAAWERDTMVVVMSTTKGLAAMTLALANARGWLDYDAPVARYWPEFAQNGKARITVRQLLGHEAGLVVLDEKVTLARLGDLDDVARLLARQKPAWPPGTRHGYHAMTLGMYMQELLRRVDPAHRTLGRFFREEIARPLNLEFYIGLPPGIPEARLAKVLPFSAIRAILALRDTPSLLIRKVLAPRSLLRRSLAVPADMVVNARRSLEVELPAGNGIGTARAIARAYSAFAEGGAELGITPETMARITAVPVVAHPNDAVIGVPSWFSLGFARPGPEVTFGLSPRAFGAPGAGGSFAFADPDARVGYAYVMNKLNFWLVDDPREKALRDALYRSIARLATRPEPATLPAREVIPAVLA